MVLMAVDLALGCLSVEGTYLLWLQRKEGALHPREFFTLGAGFFLLGALRLALRDGQTIWILPVLAGAGLCHAMELDLRQRAAKFAPGVN